MQRTVRVLRIALPIVFIGFIAIIVLSWSRTTVRPRGGPAEPVTTTRAGDQVTLESKKFEDTQTIGGRVAMRIRATRLVSHESKWVTLEGVDMTIYRANGLTYQLICPTAQFNSETKEADAKGGVTVTSSDGIEIKTAEIKFVDNRLTNNVPVTFKIDRWQGQGGALDLDIAGETLRLFNKVTATMAPQTPAEPPMTLGGDESFFRRRENDVTFTANVTMDRAADSLRADKVVGRFTQDRRLLIGLEGEGAVQMVMAANPTPGEDLGGRKTITCDRFFSEVGPDGQINAINAHAVGAAPAHAVLDGPPKRDLTARNFRIALLNKAVREIKADWGVVMKEYAETTREVSTEHATVNFDPVAHRAVSAYLEGAFRFSDPKTVATAFRAHYDIPGDRIILTTDPGWEATIVSEGNTIKAKQIEFSPRAQTAKATGSVIAQLQSKGDGVAADTTNLFPSGKPVFVNADVLNMRQADNIAVFSGNVKAWQEINTILANELQVQGMGNVITARGNVRSVLFNSGTEVRKVPLKSTSDQLIARKADKRMELVGNVSIVDEGRTLNSEKATLFFDNNRKVDRVEADQKVVVKELATQRTGTGDKANYLVQKKMIYVTGAPAVLTDPKGSLKGEQIVFDLTRNKVQVVSPGQPTQGTYKHEG
ncbi:MAG TPA: LPS export ABC transporter periplasmic protein LptC [Thermoanaerobaculia bacterium]|jgi:LPS export ABC transporter protein LptC/lipopolysaccharide transport protein LptA